VEGVERFQSNSDQILWVDRKFDLALAIEAHRTTASVGAALQKFQNTTIRRNTDVAN
jgi:hypothetical protein